MPISNVFQTDCNLYMKTIPDKFFELAIVDPPYGSEDITRTGGTWANKIDGRARIKEWDYKPKKEYFDELFRISQNQIIWGGNYFGLPANRHYLIWKKHMPENFTVGMCEYAWSSFNANPKIFEFPSNNQFMRFHPTQKPIQLYKWLLKNYAKPGDKIFDSHMGSQSSRIAAYEGGFDYYGCELDKDYFEAGCKRFDIYKSQLKIAF
jgi:site-specific DNA-methyltransferase (adenine-specific)